jgi:MinD superfamily P-loop ATPase
MVDGWHAPGRCTVTTEVCFLERLELGFVVEVNEAHCDGCRQCLHACNYGALLWVSSDQTILVDPWACSGCGTCTTICLRDAVTLRPRSER